MRMYPTGSGAVIPLGPFLSNTDFKTPVTNLAASSNNLILFAGGANGDISARSFVHMANGVYALTLLSSDLANPGAFSIQGNFATAVPIVSEFMAVAPNFYAALSGSGLMGVNTAAIAGSTTAANNLQQGALAVVPFAAQSGSSTTVLNTLLPATVNGNYNGRTVIFISGPLTGQGASITGYNGSTQQLTVTALTSAPNPGDLAVIV